MTDQILYRSQLSPAGDDHATWRTSAPRTEISGEFSLGDAGSAWGGRRRLYRSSSPMWWAVRASGFSIWTRSPAGSDTGSRRVFTRRVSPMPEAVSKPVSCGRGKAAKPCRTTSRSTTPQRLRAPTRQGSGQRSPVFARRLLMLARQSCNW